MTTQLTASSPAIASPVITLTDDSFQQEVLTSSQPVLVDFWAPWCGPCRLVAPIVESIATDLAGQVKVCKLNADQFDRIATLYQIHAIPTLLIFKDGKVVDQAIGVSPKAELVAKLTALLDSSQAA